MAIPTYAQITDAEIAPGKPIKQNLVQRLRDNVLALLAIDVTATSPVISLGIRAEVIATYATVTAVGVTMADSTGPVYAFVVPSGVALMRLELVGAGSNGSGSGGCYGGGTCVKVVSVVPGETITVTIGNNGTTGGSTTVSGSISGLRGTAGGGGTAAGGTAEGAGIPGGNGATTAASPATGDLTRAGGAANGGHAGLAGYGSAGVPVHGSGRYGSGGGTNAASGHGSGGYIQEGFGSPVYFAGTPGLAVLTW